MKVAATNMLACESISEHRRPDSDGMVFVDWDRQKALMFVAVASKIEAEPTLLQIPIDNIDRGLSKGHPAKVKLLSWKSKIELAQRYSKEFDELLHLLRDSGPEALQWKGFSPFAGVLCADELDKLR
jgi:hypothetical protein